MIELKCPSCKADIILDESREIGFCMYCGTKVLLRETASTVDGIAGVNNLLLRANQFLNEGNYDKALEYYNRVLDIDISNLQAQNGIKVIQQKKYAINVGDNVTITVVEPMPKEYDDCFLAKLPNGQIIPIPENHIGPCTMRSYLRNDLHFSMICVGYKNNIPILMSDEVKKEYELDQQSTFAERLKQKEVDTKKALEKSLSEYEKKLPDLIVEAIKEYFARYNTHKLHGYVEKDYDHAYTCVDIIVVKAIPTVYEFGYYKAQNTHKGFDLSNPQLLETNLKAKIRALGFNADKCYVSTLKHMKHMGPNVTLSKPRYKETGEFSYIIVIDIEW